MRKNHYLKIAVKSSTLIEVIMALLIISMIFSIAILIYLNVQKSGFSSRKISCNMMIDEVFASSVKSKDFKQKQIQFGDIIIYQEILGHAKANLVFVRLEARDENGKLLAEQKHLVYAPPPQP